MVVSTLSVWAVFYVSGWAANNAQAQEPGTQKVAHSISSTTLAVSHSIPSIIMHPQVSSIVSSLSVSLYSS